MLTRDELDAAIDACRRWPPRLGGCWTSRGRGLTELVRTGLAKEGTLVVEEPHPAVAVAKLRRDRAGGPKRALRVADCWDAYGALVGEYGLATADFAFDVRLSADPQKVAGDLERWAQQRAVAEELRLPAPEGAADAPPAKRLTPATPPMPRLVAPEAKTG